MKLKTRLKFPYNLPEKKKSCPYKKSQSHRFDASVSNLWANWEKEVDSIDKWFPTHSRLLLEEARGK